MSDLGRFMLAVFAAFCLALLAVGFVAGRATAQQIHHHPFHLDFYRHWKQPGSEKSCCDARRSGPFGGEVGDCEPTQAEVRGGQWHAWLRQEGRWLPIPDARILRERNPNVFDGHLCWTPSSGVICFVPPDTGG